MVPDSFRREAVGDLAGGVPLEGFRRLREPDEVELAEGGSKVVAERCLVVDHRRLLAWTRLQRDRLELVGEVVEDPTARLSHPLLHGLEPSTKRTLRSPFIPVRLTPKRFHDLAAAGVGVLDPPRHAARPLVPDHCGSPRQGDLPLPEARGYAD
jgi:hypothetical protein